MSGRRLIVCFDGTWNTPDQGGNPTNVVKLLRAIPSLGGEVSQIVFYDKGVGTGGLLDRVVGGASGAGLTENMIDGYRFLANNHHNSDELYIFGFSRGAYTARSLVGFIGLTGLISPLDLGSGLHSAVEIYRDASLTREQKLNKLDKLSLERTRDVRIKCIGVWDTVGSLGIPGDLGRRGLSKKHYFHDVQLSDMVDVALHAVAIDEKRSAFAPTLWVRCKDSTLASDQIVEQVWFSGVHSNIGGSYLDAGLSDIALDWMVKRVRRHTELVFDDNYLKNKVQPDPTGKGVESRSTLYKTSVLFPYQRLIGQAIPKGTGIGEWFRTTFPSFDRRNIPPDGLQTINEMLHVSALERCTQPVVNDCPEKSNCEPSIYRPPTLVTAIQSRSVPVVDWDGNVLTDEEVPWPRL